MHAEHRQLVEEHEGLQNVLSKESSFDDTGEPTTGNVGAPSSLPRNLSIEFNGDTLTDSIQGELETKR